MAYFLGLDLGGTNIKAGIVDEAARVQCKLSRPTPAKEGPEAVCGAIQRVAQEACEKAKLTLADITAVGLGSPGPLDLDAGMVVAMPNMTGWSYVPLRQKMADRLQRPVVLENDANAASFGEFWDGAGRDPKIRHLVMLTLGTGIGSGIIVDGAVLHGKRGLAGEGGHMIVVPDGRLCGCGQRGCIEAYSSATNVARRTQEALQAGQASTLQTLFKAGTAITSKEVFEHAEKGDALALQIVDETARYLAITCINLCRVLDPQMIVFAGGMAEAGEMLLERIRTAFLARDWKVAQTECQIARSLLGNDAGFIGAAGVAWHAWKSDKLV